MTKQEAMQLGYHYTGMSQETYREERIKAMKKIASQIKKDFKGADFKVVDTKCDSRCGVCHYKTIYGNDIFMDVLHFQRSNSLEYLASGHQKNLDNIKARYEEELRKEMERFEETKKVFDRLQSLRK